MTASSEIREPHRIPGALYTGGARLDCTHPDRRRRARRTNVTQVGRALAPLGIVRYVDG